MRILIVLLVLAGLLYLALRLLKNRTKKASGLALLDYFPLGPRRGIAVVRVYGNVLVLGVTPQQIQLLKDLPAENVPPDVLASKGTATTFRTILGGME